MDKNMWNWHIHSSFTNNRFGWALQRQVQIVCACTHEDMHMYDTPWKKMSIEGNTAKVTGVTDWQVAAADWHLGGLTSASSNPSRSASRSCLWFGGFFDVIMWEAASVFNFCWLNLDFISTNYQICTSALHMFSLWMQLTNQASLLPDNIILQPLVQIWLCLALKTYSHWPNPNVEVLNTESRFYWMTFCVLFRKMLFSVSVRGIFANF